ncbi:MAG TPA: MFS transporter [Thermoanaerobaculia bacterium]|nr:MFS transporter [Thermoanaerobaculia bacterium]
MPTPAHLPCDEGVLRAGPAADCAPAAGPWVLAATILGSSMAFIDGTAVNVALPALQRDLGAAVSGVQWVVEAYALFLAGLLLVGGALGDRFGRRRIFLLGIGGFAAASAWCGLAPSLAQLVAARSVQGVAAALLVPGSLALLSASFPPDRRGRAIGTWSGATAITAAVGPLLGGWLVDHASWRWVFFLNLPLAVAVLVLGWTRVPESRDSEAAQTLDGWGALLATAGLGALTFGLVEWPRLGPRDPRVAGTLAGGVLALAGFVWVEARRAAPMMPLSLFRSKTFAGANLLTLFLYAALGGSLFFLPFDLISVQGYSATAAGAALLPFILLMSILSRWAGGLVDRYGSRLPLVIGPAVAALGFALFARAGVGGSYWTTFFPAVLVLGVGMTIAVAPLTTTVMGAVEVRHAGVASGINNAVSRVAGLLAVAVFGIVLVAVFNAGRERRLDDLRHLGLPTAARAELDRSANRLAAAPIPASLPAEQKAAVRRALDDAFVDGFRRTMLLSAGLALLAALAAAGLIEGQRSRSSEESGSETIRGSSEAGSSKRVTRRPKGAL